MNKTIVVALTFCFLFLALVALFFFHTSNNVVALIVTDMPSSRPIDIPDAKKRNKKKKRCRATDSFSGRFEGKYLSSPYNYVGSYKSSS